MLRNVRVVIAALFFAFLGLLLLPMISLFKSIVPGIDLISPELSTYESSRIQIWLDNARTVDINDPDKAGTQQPSLLVQLSVPRAASGGMVRGELKISMFVNRKKSDRLQFSSLEIGSTRPGTENPSATDPLKDCKSSQGAEGVAVTEADSTAKGVRKASGPLKGRVTRVAPRVATAEFSDLDVTCPIEVNVSVLQNGQVRTYIPQINAQNLNHTPPIPVLLQLAKQKESSISNAWSPASNVSDSYFSWGPDFSGTNGPWGTSVTVTEPDRESLFAMQLFFAGVALGLATSLFVEALVRPR